jgi:hypothetical protein
MKLPTIPLAILLALPLVLLAATGLAFGQATQGTPTVTARLTTGVVRLGADAAILLDVEGIQSATIGELPSVDGLRLGPVGSPMISSYQSWDGRRRVSSVKLSYRIPIVAERKGNFTIPPISVNAGTVNAGGKTVQTPELAFKVVDDLKGEERGYFHIDAPAQVVEGQPFLFELRFGYDAALGEIGEKVNYLNLMLPWLDQLPGLLELDPPAPTAGAGIVSPIGLNQRGTTRAERIPPVTENGRTFQMLRIRKRYIATRSGKLDFPTSHLEFGQVENQGIFSTGPADKVTFFKRTPAFAIEVLELPEAGRPLDYTGAVGALAASATVDRRDVDAGESIKVSVEWSGEGNLEFFEPPDPSRMEAFKDFRLYGTNDRKTPDRRVVVYDLAPISPDAKTIPPIPLVVFDPAKKSYVTIATEPIPIRVRALKASSGLATEESSKPEPGLDIRDIQTETVREGEVPRPGGGAVLATTLAVPLLWLGLRVVVRRRGDPDAPAARARRAARRALQKELARSKTASDQARALEAFLGARTGEHPQAWIGRDAEAWSSAFVRPRLSPESAKDLKSLMGRLDERAWARGDTPLELAEIERTADELLKGGL